MAVLIHPDGTTTIVKPADGKLFTLEELQGCVGGLIEQVGEFYDDVSVLVDEEGRLKGVQPNRVASELLGYLVLGPALFIHDAEWD